LFAKEYSDKGLKERLWADVGGGKDGNAGHYEESPKYGVSATACALFHHNDILTQTFVYNPQYQNTSTESNIPNSLTVNSPAVAGGLSS